MPPIFRLPDVIKPSPGTPAGSVRCADVVELLLAHGYPVALSAADELTLRQAADDAGRHALVVVLLASVIAGCADADGLEGARVGEVPLWTARAGSGAAAEWCRAGADQVEGGACVFASRSLSPWIW